MVTPDPGVAEDARVALAQHRAALAKARRNEAAMIAYLRRLGDAP
jgi:hypothetical protein